METDNGVVLYRTTEHFPRCHLAGVFERLAEETIFARLPGQLTQEDVEAALTSLAALKETLTHQLATFHAPGIGGHRCVAASYRLAESKLRNLLLLQPAPQPPEPPPAPPPKPRTLRDVLEALGGITDGE